MHIRFFNLGEPVSSFYRDLIPELVRAGHRVTIFTGASDYRAGRGRLQDHLPADGVTIRTIPSGAGGRLIAYLRYIVCVIWWTLFGTGADLNFFLTQPPLFYIWGWCLLVLRRQPYVVLIMDLYPDILEEYGYLDAGSRRARLLRRVSRFVLKRSQQVITIGRCMQDRLAADGLPRSLLAMIPNWVDERQIYPIDHAHNPMRRELHLPDSAFVVLYSGNMGVLHDFDDLLGAARLLADLPDLYFIFIGDGKRRVEVEAAKAQYNLERVLLLPFQPVERLAESQSLGDLHVVSLRTGFAGLAVPSKTYGAFAAARPVLYIGEAQGEIARVVQEYELGIAIPVGQPAQLAAAIRGYFLQRDQAQIAGERAYHLAQTTFSRTNAVAAYRGLLEGL